MSIRPSTWNRTLRFRDGLRDEEGRNVRLWTVCLGCLQTSSVLKDKHRVLSSVTTIRPFRVILRSNECHERCGPSFTGFILVPKVILFTGVRSPKGKRSLFDNYISSLKNGRCRKYKRKESNFSSSPYSSENPF